MRYEWSVQTSAKYIPSHPEPDESSGPWLSSGGLTSDRAEQTKARWVGQCSEWCVLLTVIRTRLAPHGQLELHRVEQAEQWGGARHLHPGHCDGQEGGLQDPEVVTQLRPDLGLAQPGRQQAAAPPASLSGQRLPWQSLQRPRLLSESDVD